MADYDFRAWALRLPGVQRVFMMDQAAGVTTIPDYAQGQSGTARWTQGTINQFTQPTQQSRILRRQSRRTFSIRARDSGGRAIGNYIRNTTPVALSGVSWWQVATCAITALDQVHCVLGHLAVATGGAGNAFALVVNTDGSVSAGFDTKLANLHKSATGLVQAPYGNVFVVSWTQSSGTLQVWVNGTLAINLPGLSGVTNASIAAQLMGGLHNDGATTTTSSQLDNTQTQVGLASVANNAATGGFIGVVKNPLPTSNPAWPSGICYTPDPTRDWHEGFAYTGISGSNLTGLTPIVDGVTAQGSYASPTTVTPYYATFRRGFYGPWAIGTGSPLTSTQAQLISKQSGLLDHDVSPVLFSRRIGHRNARLPASPVIDANSAKLAGTLKAQYNGATFLNIKQFTERVHKVDETIPRAQMINHHFLGNVSGGNAEGFDWNQHEWFRSVPIPADRAALMIAEQPPPTTLTGSAPTLPTNTLNVVSTAGYPSSGILVINDSGAPGQIAYTGTTPTSFTGCSGGSGTPTAGASVQFNVIFTSQLGQAGTDHDAVIIDRRHGMVWSLWGVYYNSIPAYSSPTQPIMVNDGLWHFRWGGFLSDIDGITDAIFDGQQNQWGASATSAETLGGSILVSEAYAALAGLDNAIPHVIDIATNLNAGTFRWPAQRTDGTGTGVLAGDFVSGGNTILNVQAASRLSSAFHINSLPMPIYDGGAGKIPPGTTVTAISADAGSSPSTWTITMSNNASATGTQAAFSWAPLQEGSIYVVPQGVTLNSSTVPNNPLGLAIAKAAQRYGFRLRDTNGGASITMFAEPGDTYIAKWGYDPWFGTDANGNQVVSSDSTLLGPHGTVNLVPTSIMQQLVLVDATWYQAYCSQPRNYQRSR